MNNIHQTSWKVSNAHQSRFVINPVSAALLTMLVVMVCVWAFEYSERQRFYQQSRADAINRLSTIRAKLEAALNSRLFLMRGLSAYVSIHPEMTQAEFADVAKEALGQQNGIHSLMLAKGRTITHIYPLKGNESAMGIDLMALTEQRKAVQRTLETGETIVVRSASLVESGVVTFVSYLPIYTSPNHPLKGSEWGLGMVLINQEHLFEECGLLNTSHFRYALHGQEGLGGGGQVFFGHANIFQQSPVILSVSIPNGSWRLAAVPVAGWPNSAPISKWLWIIGSMLALMMGILVFTVLRAPAQLQEAVDNATKELQQTNENLSETMKELKATQQELVQSEKMATLGQLVAGIAHEINTPLGAIRSSVGNISKFLEQTLEQLPQFFDLLETQQKSDFFALLQRSLQQKTVFSVKEERKFKRALTHILEQHDVKNATTIATKLVSMGIYDQIDDLLPLLKDTNSADIIQTAYKLSGLQKSAQNISIATTRASKVVFALKNFARYDMSGEKVPANLIDGIETVLTLYHNQIKQGVEIIRHYVELPILACYPDELNQVWTNLIHNALQAMNHKGTLQIEVEVEDSKVLISITDNGTGIPVDIQPKIFEPFFTTKPPGEGSGLGLDIVKKIIEKHDGKITFTSEPGKTTFTVSIPNTLKALNTSENS